MPFCFAIFKKGKLEGILPAKGKISAYQVIILANDVSKEELEKVMLSYIK
ncbi:UNVERIFIED_ORG: bla regulator protein BlaR1 [Bacillus proteolyticus]